MRKKESVIGWTAGVLAILVATFVGAWNGLAWGGEKTSTATKKDDRSSEGNPQEMLNKLAVSDLDEANLAVLDQQIQLECEEYTAGKLVDLMSQADGMQPFFDIDPRITETVCHVEPGMTTLGDLLGQLNAQNNWACRAVVVKETDRILGILIEPALPESDSLPKIIGCHVLNTVNIAGIVYRVIKRGLLP